MGFLHNLVADIPDNYQNTNDDEDEPKPKKRKKPNPPIVPSS